MSTPKPLPALPLADLVLPARGPVYSQQFPKDFPGKLSTLVGSMIDREGWVFSCGDSPGEEEIELTTEEVASPDGMLPLVVREASSLMRLALGAPPSMRWATVPGSLCMIQPDEHQEESASLGMWALFCHYALETLVGASPKAVAGAEPASLTRWRHAFLADIDRGELRPVAIPAQRPAVRAGGDR